MDALDDIRRLIAETEQEVKKTAVKKRCWGVHAWTPWVDAPMRQERRCTRCNKLQQVAMKDCAHIMEVLEFSHANRDDAWIGYASFQQCTRCGITDAVVDKF